MTYEHLKNCKTRRMQLIWPFINTFFNSSCSYFVEQIKRQSIDFDMFLRKRYHINLLPLNREQLGFFVKRSYFDQEFVKKGRLIFFFAK